MIQQLNNAITEKDVENTWRSKILQLFPNSKMTSPFNTDGFLETEDGKISILCEFKFETELKSKLSQINVLSQALFYLKKFEKSGTKLPKVIFIADRNECFVIHSNPLSKYLDYDLNWSVAASTAFKVNTDLIQEMMGDSSINPYVFDINEGFNYVAIKNKIEDLSNNVVRLIKVTEHNINTVFEYFQKNVLGKNALSVNETANLFVNLIINPNENYLHPKRRNILITKSFGDVYVNTDKYVAFFTHFDGEQYSIREKEKLTSIVDRIVEDETRRRKGEFFTPTIWVDEAHKMIIEAFGENWKEEYIVWDPACGTLNLTRDYQFKELYCSTIEESDLKTADQMKYNPEAVKFQYDFLNDGIVDGKIDIDSDSKLPEGLKVALKEGKKIIVLMNPPYGSASINGKGSKKDMATTQIQNLMKNDKWGASSQQLYAQFLYRLTQLNNRNIKICMFSPPLFMSGESYKKFRNLFLKSFGFNNGFLMNAGEFDGTSDWGLSFTIWDESKKRSDNFELIVKKSNNFGDIFNLFKKNIYNLYFSKNYKDDFKSKSDFLFPNLTSGLNISEKYSAMSNKDSIGYLYIKGNSVERNSMGICLLTSTFAHSHGISVMKDKFLNVLSLFSARKLIKPTWINQKDEYMAPDESHKDWLRFQYDSIVYSLFNTSSNQSSLRQIDYKEKKWDIKNEFFWMSKEEIMKLSEDKNFDDVYRDARFSENRHVYKLLFEEGIYDKLSDDAKLVLDTASNLVKETFEMREFLHMEHPEYHLNTWDAGWYQVKLILKQFYPEKLKDFSSKYKAMEDRLRPMVYELGFLKK